MDEITKFLIRSMFQYSGNADLPSISLNIIDTIKRTLCSVFFLSEVPCAPFFKTLRVRSSTED